MLTTCSSKNSCAHVVLVDAARSLQNGGAIIFQSKIDDPEHINLKMHTSLLIAFFVSWLKGCGKRPGCHKDACWEYGVCSLRLLMFSMSSVHRCFFGRPPLLRTS